VPAGHHERELVAAGFAEDGQALIGAPRLAAGVVPQLLEEASVPFRIDDAPEDVVNDGLLFFRVKVAANVRFGDLPVVRLAESIIN
jgi:hypothetical protein